MPLMTQHCGRLSRLDASRDCKMMTSANEKNSTRRKTRHRRRGLSNDCQVTARCWPVRPGWLLGRKSDAGASQSRSTEQIKRSMRLWSTGRHSDSIRSHLALYPHWQADYVTNSGLSHLLNCVTTRSLTFNEHTKMQ